MPEITEQFPYLVMWLHLDRDDGPYGQKNDLGWEIVGTIKNLEKVNSDLVGVSHRIITNQRYQ